MMLLLCLFRFFCVVNAEDVESFIATLGGKMKSVVSA